MPSYFSPQMRPQLPAMSVASTCRFRSSTSGYSRFTRSPMPYSLASMSWLPATNRRATLCPPPPPVVRKHLPPCVGMELHFLHLSAMRHVAAMDNRVYVPLPETVQRRDEMPVGIVLVSFAVMIRAYVRIAENAKDEVRLAFRLPTGRRCKEPTAWQRQKTQRRQRLFQKLPPSRFHVAVYGWTSPSPNLSHNQ